jgi:hypothetical protein
MLTIAWLKEAKMTVKTTEQKVAEIQDLEIAISKIQLMQGGPYGHLFPKILKLTRKMQKLRNQL